MNSLALRFLFAFITGYALHRACDDPARHTPLAIRSTAMATLRTCDKPSPTHRAERLRDARLHPAAAAIPAWISLKLASRGPDSAVAADARSAP